MLETHVDTEIWTVVNVVGQLDPLTAPEVQDRLTPLLDRGPQTLVVDLSRVTFMDSTGLDLLLDMKKALESERGFLVLLNPSDPVLKVLELTGMSAVFELLQTRPPTAGTVPFRLDRQRQASKSRAGTWDLSDSGVSTFFG
jgi:anti-sigma B factor antagonist